MTRAAIATLAVIAETGWVFIGAILLAEGIAQGAPPSFATLLAAAGLAFVLSTLVVHFESAGAAVTAIAVAVSLVMVYALARLEYAADLALHDFEWFAASIRTPDEALSGKGWLPLGVFLIAGVWVRNSLRAVTPIAFDGVLRSVSVGLAVILAGAAASDALADTQLPAALLPVAAVNMLALALGHTLRAESRGRGMPATVEAAIAAVVVLAIVAVAVAAGLLAGQDLAGLLTPVAEAVATVLAFIVYAVSLPVFLVVYALLRLGLFLSGRSEQDIAETLNLANENLRDALVRPQVTGEGGGPDWLGIALRVIQVLVAAAVLAVVLLLIYRRVRHRAPSDDGVRESTYGRGSIVADLKAAAGALLRRRPHLPSMEHHRPIARLYFEVLREARSRGVGGDPAVTPLELAPELVVAFNSTAPRDIARSFSAFAYGRVEPPEPDVERMRDDWQRALRVDAATS